MALDRHRKPISHLGRARGKTLSTATGIFQYDAVIPRDPDFFLRSAEGPQRLHSTR